MSNIQKIAKTYKIPQRQVAAAAELLDAGNTIPFIARYRKEATDGLDEEQLRQVSGALDKLRALDERRETILKSIQEQGKLTGKLREQLMAAETRTELEDLYQPYKPKRKTRASVAREKGLEPLAEMILAQPLGPKSLSALVKPFLNEGVPTAAEAWAGARDIAAETISDHPEIRRLTRQKAAQWGVLKAEKIKKAEDPKGVYQNYYAFEYRVDRLRPHQVLAVNRGEKEKVLRVKFTVNERDWRYAVNTVFQPNPRSPLAGQLNQAVEDAADRLLLPAIGRDIRRDLTERAEMHAIRVFADNLRNLLTQPPLTGRVVMGIDPGYRTGCKAAVVDPTGKPLDTATIYPHPPQKAAQKAKETLTGMIKRGGVSLIAIGNGTASRETEGLVAELIKSLDLDLHYLMISEAGASVYSASTLARAELPEMDVSMRGAVSIARRAQDPLAELVKIDPRSIGVGMYQHDVNQKELEAALDAVVESVVNTTGVDVNSASSALLTYVAGIGPKLADRMVKHRDQHGPFRTRASFKRVTGLGPRAFEQSAGFLRVREGDNPLDRSAIHPESYPAAKQIFRRTGISLDSPLAKREAAVRGLGTGDNLQTLAADLGTGVLTLEDILAQIIQPGRDPRADLPAPILRSDVLKMEDLTPGMTLKGTVRNVVDFGAFIDIGVKQDGLLHRSQYPAGTRPAVGNVVTVVIINVEIDRGRIALGWSGGS